MTQTVGIAIIAKNESALISRCLESVKRANEIVVVDTGSVDNTMDIARNFTEKVFNDYQFTTFAEARNHVKSKMQSAWILSIDCDEFLSVDFDNVKEAASRARHAVNCRMVDERGTAEFDFPRLFRNSPEIRWEGVAHNHLNVGGENVGNVRITFGCSPAHELDPDRTLRLLESRLAEQARELYYLGREYQYKGRHDDALTILRRYVQVSDFPGEKSDAFLLMARSLHAMNRWSEARDAASHAIMINPQFREAIEFMALLCGDGQGREDFQRNADQWKRMAATATNEGVLFVRK